MTTHRWMIALACLALPLFVGCGSQPQISHDNRRLIESVLTAVSTRNAEWLAANEKLVEQRQTAGAMDAAEYKTFRSILDLAKQGNWQSAEERVYALRDAQQATSADLNRVENRQAEEHQAPRKTRVRARL